MFRQKRMDRRIKFICPFDLAEHQGVEPWHRSPGLSHFESLNRLDEAGFVRLSWAAEGILATSKKARHTAICRQKSAIFLRNDVRKSLFHTGRQRLHFRCSCVRCPLEICSAAVAVPAHSRLPCLNAAFPESREMLRFLLPALG